MYATRTGHSEKLAHDFAAAMRGAGGGVGGGGGRGVGGGAGGQGGTDCGGVRVLDISEVDVAGFCKEVSAVPGTLLVLFVSTWEEGLPCFDARPFFDWLQEGSTEVRKVVEHLRYAVCGLGSSAPRYLATYQAAGRKVYAQLEACGALAVCDLGEEDEQVPGVGYKTFLQSFFEKYTSNNLPTRHLSGAEPGTRTLGPSHETVDGSRAQVPVSVQRSSSEDDPCMIRLLWLGGRQGVAARVCDAVAVRFRPVATSMGCVVVSQGADTCEPDTLAADTAVFVFTGGGGGVGRGGHAAFGVEDEEEWFVQWFRDASLDWRVEGSLLGGLLYGIYVLREDDFYIGGEVNGIGRNSSIESCGTGRGANCITSTNFSTSTNVSTGTSMGASAFANMKKNESGAVSIRGRKEAKDIDYALFKLGASRLFSPISFSSSSSFNTSSSLITNIVGTSSSEALEVDAILTHLTRALLRALGNGSGDIQNEAAGTKCSSTLDMPGTEGGSTNETLSDSLSSKNGAPPGQRSTSRTGSSKNDTPGSITDGSITDITGDTPRSRNTPSRSSAEAGIGEQHAPATPPSPASAVAGGCGSVSGGGGRY